MTPERWKLVASLFHKALERPTAEREAFLAPACGDDLELRHAVDTLLAEHQRTQRSLRITNLAASNMPTAFEKPGEEAGGLVGAVLGDRYRVDALLGRGGMGAVYRATQVDLDRTVAVKVVLGELLAKRSVVARFKREAFAASRLHHPHIVSVYDVGLDAEAGAYLVMEYLEGRTLRMAVRNGGPLPVEEALGLMQQVCSAVSAAHAAGVVHRDLKADNIFLVEASGEGPTAKVLDFGIAKVIAEVDESRLTRTGTVLGTPSYMAPEQWEGREVDARTDVYALGCLAYEVFVGRPPYQADSIAELGYKHLNESPMPLGQQREGLPEGLDAAVLRALAKVPEDRFQTAEDLWRALIGKDEG